MTPNVPLTPAADRAAPRAWAILALLFLFYCYPIGVWPRFIGPNETSRVFLTMSLYETGELALDRQVSAYWRHNDLAYYQGHYYSNKPPGSSLWMLLFTPLVDWITPGRLVLMDLMYFGRVLALTLPFVGFLYLLGRALQERAGPVLAWGLVLAYALASNAAVYATMYYSHNLTAAAHCAAFLVLMKRPRGRAFWAGLLTSFGVLCEVMTVAVPFVLAAYAWATSSRERRLREIGQMAAGSLPCAALFFGHNWLVFGDPFTVGYTLSGAHLHRYQDGRLGLSLPNLNWMRLLLFSFSRGLFVNAPWTLLAVPAAAALWRRRREKESADHFAAFACAAALILTVACGPFKSSGFSTGSRYLVPALAFLLFPIASWLRGLDERRQTSALIALAAGVMLGAGQNALALMVFPVVPYLGNNLVSPFRVFTVHGLLTGHGTFTLATLAGASVKVSNWIFLLLYFAPWLAYVTSLPMSVDGRRLRPIALGLLIGLLGLLWLAVVTPVSPTASKDRDSMIHWMYDDTQQGRFRWK